MSTENRLIDLETRLTYAEDLLDSLNDVVAKQQMELLELRNLCRSLLEQLKQHAEPMSNSAKDNIPPHY